MTQQLNQATTRESMFFTPCTVLAVVIAVGCSGGEGAIESRPAAMNTAVSPQEMRLDACDLLKTIGIDDVLGEAVGEAQPQLQMEATGRSVSQCRYDTISENRSVTLMLRYSAVDRNPVTRSELADSESSADVLGMGGEAAAAVMEGEEITGLGDLAFTYQMLGLNLMVFWNQNYQMTVMVDGFADDAEAVDRAKTVAQRVLEELSK